jgi:CheY-like chemotaxis protein
MVVLIVDDEPIVAETTAAIFRLAGHEAHWVRSSKEALDLAPEVNPDLLMADVVMPNDNGIDLAIKFLTQFPTCKILLISGQAETTDLLEQARKKGYEFEILAKPLWPPDLLARAEQIVGTRTKSEGAGAQS